MMTSSASRASSSNSRLMPSRSTASSLNETALAVCSRFIQLPMDRFGHERIHGPGRRMDEARPSREKKPVPEEDAQEIDRWIEHEFQRRRLPPPLQPLLSLESGVGDLFLHLLVQWQTALVPQQPSVRDRRLPMISDEAFVHDERWIEACPAPPHKPQDMLGPRPATDRLCLAIERE